MTPYIERRPSRRYWIVYPAEADAGMSFECGPFLTRWGARWHLRVWGR